MPAVATRTFSFICGQDDFLVGRMGKKRFEELAGDAADEFSREIVNGFALNVDEVETAVNRFREAVQTMPMFGGRRVVWLQGRQLPRGHRDREGRDHAEGRRGPAAGPAVGRPRRDGRPRHRGARGPPALVPQVVREERRLRAGGRRRGRRVARPGRPRRGPRPLGVEFGPGAVELLLAKIGANTRLLVEEVHKLAAHAEGGRIEEADVAEMTPNAAQGDFFETADAFFSGDLQLDPRRAEAALLRGRRRAAGPRRPPEPQPDPDPGPGPGGRRRGEGRARGGSTASRARPQAHGAKFGEAAAEKSSFNVFTQNPWYVGKLAGPPPCPPCGA